MITHGLIGEVSSLVLAVATLLTVILGRKQATKIHETAEEINHAVNSTQPGETSLKENVSDLVEKVESIEKVK